MIISLYNYFMVKMRLKEMDKTIEMFGDDVYSAQLIHLQAQQDMLQYEKHYWKSKLKLSIFFIILIVFIIFATYNITNVLL